MISAISVSSWPCTSCSKTVSAWAASIVAKMACSSAISARASSCRSKFPDETTGGVLGTARAIFPNYGSLANARAQRIDRNIRGDRGGPGRQAAGPGKFALDEGANDALEHDLHLVVVIGVALQNAAQGAVDHRLQAVVKRFGRPFFTCNQARHNLLVRGLVALRQAIAAVERSQAFGLGHRV